MVMSNQLSPGMMVQISGKLFRVESCVKVTVPKRDPFMKAKLTDLSSQKRRPVIVISNNDYNRKSADLVVVAMTSNPVAVDYTFTITSSDLA